MWFILVNFELRLFATSADYFFLRGLENMPCYVEECMALWAILAHL